MRSSWLYFATRSRARGRAGLDLAGAGRDREVGDGRVLRLAGAVRDDRGVAVRLREPIASIVSVSVPIWLTLMRIELATPRSMPALQPLGVGDEEVVADELEPLAEPLGRALPAVPVVLGDAVLERDDREAVERVRVEVGHLRRASLAALEAVDAVGEELARRRVERDRDLLAVAGPLGRVEDRLDRLLARRQVRREAALVADGGREAPLASAPSSARGRLGADPQRLGERRRRRPGRP